VKILNKVLDWLGKFVNAYTAWTVGFPIIAGLISAYLSNSVSSIKALGPWGWLMAGITVSLAAAAILALIARAQLWRVEAKFKELLSGDSSKFDSMQQLFQDKRVFLRDLVPPGGRIIKGRKFINCEIIGPGNMIVMLKLDKQSYPTFKDNTYHNVDFIQIDENKQSNTAIYFYDCDFDGCNFYSVNLLFYTRITEEWAWITPANT
jgi:hypothetical protein